MPGMQHDNNNIDGYRDQESKNEEETCGRPFRRGQEPRAERVPFWLNDSNFENARNQRPISLVRLVRWGHRWIDMNTIPRPA